MCPVLWRAPWECTASHLLRDPSSRLPPGPLATLWSASWHLGPAGPCPPSSLTGKDSGSVVEVWGPREAQLMSSGCLWRFAPRTFWCSPHQSHRHIRPERKEGWAKCHYKYRPLGMDELCASVCSDQVFCKERCIYACLKWGSQISQLHWSTSLIWTQECLSFSIWEVLSCLGKNLTARSILTVILSRCVYYPIVTYNPHLLKIHPIPFAWYRLFQIFIRTPWTVNYHAHCAN